MRRLSTEFTSVWKSTTSKSDSIETSTPFGITAVRGFSLNKSAKLAFELKFNANSFGRDDPTMSNPLQAESFDHVTLIVADLAATRHFYVELLGLEEVRRPDFDFAGAWFQVGTVQLHATLSDELAGKAGWGDRGVVRLSRGHHFAFRVADVEAAASRATEQGIEIATELKLRPDGVKQLFVYDPDRHLIELFSD